MTVEALHQEGRSSKTLKERIRAAIHYALELNEEHRQDGEWCTPLFEFARLCKADPELRNLPSDRALVTVGAILRELMPRIARDDNPWKFWFRIKNADDATTDFMGSWENVRHIPGEDALTTAVAVATSLTMKIPQPRAPGYELFIKVAAVLHNLKSEPLEDGLILLPCERLAMLFGVEPRTISRYRQWAVADGYLKVVEHHRARQSATKFRYLGPKAPPLKKSST